MGIRHRFRVDNRTYVYDAVSNQVLELAEELYDLLPRWERLRRRGRHGELGCATRGEPLYELWTACREGLLSDNLPSLVDPTALPSFAKALMRSASTISLCLTERCNLRCAYCPYTQNIGSRRTHSSRSMSLRVAKQALTLFRRMLAENETPLVSFYGGEPLLEFCLLRSVVEFTHTTFASQPVEFNMTTNGTIMNEEIAQFLVQNNFNLLVSLDGPQKLHDRYRKDGNGRGSYERVIEMLSIIKDVSPSYFDERVAVNIVLAPPLEIDSLNEYLMSDMPVPVARCAISLVDGSDTNFLQFHPYTPKDARSLKALRHRAEQGFISGRWDNDPLVLLLFKKPLLRIAFRSGTNISHKPFIPTGQCFPGGHKLFVDTKGLLHMCERIDERCPIGDVDTGINADAVQGAFAPFFEDALKTCGDCWGLRLCGVCLESTISGGRFSSLRKTQSCAEARRQLHNNLVSYVRIVERNPRAFYQFAPLEPQKSFAEVLKL